MIRPKVISVGRKKLHYVGLVGMLLLLIQANVWGQDHAIDSLKTVLQQDNLEEEDRIDTMIRLGKKVYHDSLDEALAIGNEVLVLSRNASYERGIAESYFLLGRCNLVKGDTEKAKFQLKTAVDHFNNIEAYKRTFSVYNNLGYIYKREGNFKDALQTFRESKNNASKANDKFGESVALTNIGVIYYRTGQFELATSSYIEAIKLKEEIGEKHGIGLVSANLGNLFRDQGDYTKSLDYYQKGIVIFEELDDQTNLAKAYNEIGRAYIEMEKAEEALKNFKNSFEHFQVANDTLEMANVLSNISRLNYQNGNYELSLEDQLQALTYYRSIGNRAGEGQALSQIGIIHFKLNLEEEAIDNINLGLAIATEIEDRQTQMESYKGLYQFYEGKDDIRMAHDYFKKYSVVKDSLFDIEKANKINLLEARYNLEKQEEENKLLVERSKTQTAQLEKKNLQQNILIGAIIVFILFALYFYRVYLQKKKTSELLIQRNEEINKKQAQIISINESLKKSQKQLHIANKELQKLNEGLESTVKERTAALELLNKELDTFLYQSSHALRRPVVSVMGLTQLARMEKPEDQDALDGLYDKIDDTLIRMDLMLKKLVMASEINFIQLQNDHIDFNDITMSIKENLVKKLKVEELQFSLKIAPGLRYVGDKRLITVVFQNLIENAMLYYNKALERQAAIDITINQTDTGTHIKIHDNGIGISQKVIASIFNMFTVGNEQGQGYGLGLYLVKKAVDKLRGNIHVDSKDKEYTTFIIDLPAYDLTDTPPIDSTLEYVNQN